MRAIEGWAMRQNREVLLQCCQCLSNREGRNVSKFNLCLSCYQRENAFSMGKLIQFASFLFQMKLETETVSSEGKYLRQPPT